MLCFAKDLNKFVLGTRLKMIVSLGCRRTILYNNMMLELTPNPQRPFFDYIASTSDQTNKLKTNLIESP